MTEEFRRDLELLVSEFDSLPDRAAKLLAYRAAMRVLPMWAGEINLGPGSPKRWADIGLVLDCILAGIGSMADDVEVHRAACEAYGAVDSGPRDSVSVEIACSTAEFAVQGVFDPGFTESDLARSSAAAILSAERALPAPAGRRARLSDIERLRLGIDILEVPLWDSRNPVETEWHQAAEKWRAQSATLRFFCEWYQKALDGKPQDWPLLREIALIDGMTWRAGGDSLDLEIKRLVEQHRLLDEVRRLKAELKAASASAVAHRGHNNPPELIDTASVEISSAVRAISEQLDAAEQELEQREPSLATLRRVGKVLLDAATAAAKYCSKLGDIAAQAAAKKLGEKAVSWVGWGGAYYVLTNSRSIKDLAEALLKFAGAG